MSQCCSYRCSNLHNLVVLCRCRVHKYVFMIVCVCLPCEKFEDGTELLRVSQGFCPLCSLPPFTSLLHLVWIGPLILWMFALFLAFPSQNEPPIYFISNMGLETTFLFVSVCESACDCVCLSVSSRFSERRM